MGEVVELLRNENSKAELIATLETLLSNAKAGPGGLIGLAYAAMYDQNHYSVDLAGETKLHLTFTRGMLKALDDELAKLLAGP